MHLEVLRERQLMYLRIYSLVVSPDGNRLAAATSAGTVAIFYLNKDDSENITQTCEVPVMANRAYSLASTPHHLICGDSRGVIRAWKWENLASKVPITEPAFTINIGDYSRRSDVTLDINSLVVFSSDHGSQMLAVGCGDGIMYCFDLSCGKLIRAFEGHKDFIHQVTFNRARSQLYSCSEDGLIKIWDLKSTQQVANISPGSSRKTTASSGDWVGCIAVSDAGDFLAFGGGVQPGIYNIPMASYAATLEPASLQAHSALFCGDKLLFGGQSSSLYVYSVDGKLQNEIPLPGLKGVFAITPCLDSSLTAVAGIGSKVELVRHYAYRSASLTIS